MRIISFTVAGSIALWLRFELVAIALGIVSWVVSADVSLAVVALVLYVGYVLVSTVLS